MNPSSVNEMIRAMPGAIDDSIKVWVRLFWDHAISALKEHWLLIVAILIVLFIFAFIKAKQGWWGALGSYLYNFLYFGILLVVGLMFGPEVFVANWFAIVCTIILYPICYKIVGIILDKTGVKKWAK